MITGRHIRFAWIGGLIILVGFLLYKAIAPFGAMTYSTDFLSRDYFISPLAPRERIAGSEGTAARTLVGEPAYFSLVTPRPFRTAEMTIKIEQPAPLVEVGIRRDATVWNYERWPIYFETLERLAKSPDVIIENSVMLWQREKKYGSIAEFLRRLPPPETIAAYNYGLKGSFALPDYAPFPSSHSYPVGIRGNYIFQTYSGGEAIELTFAYHDLNLNKDGDPVNVTIYNEKGEPVKMASAEDDGETGNATSMEKEIAINTGRIASGPYRVEFKVNDDIVTDKIITPQSRLAFVNRLRLAEVKRKQVTVYTDSSYMSVQTVNPASLQTVNAGGQPFELAETYRQSSLNFNDQSRRIKKIELSADDVIIAGDGVFAFSSEELINPSTRQLNERTDLNRAGIDYVIAGYAPVGDSRPVIKTINIGLSGAYREKGAYSFLIAAPGIGAASKGMEITSLSMALRGQALGEFFQDLWKRK